MGGRRKTTITIETHRLAFVRAARRAPAPAWCAACGARAEMLTPEQAAALSGLSVRAVYRAVEAGEFHFTEATGGALFVCLDSVRRAF